MGQIVGIFGDRQSGKTSLCLEIIRRLQNEGLQTGGFISPGCFDDSGQKSGIDTVLLPTLQRRALAVRRPEPVPAGTSQWILSNSTLNWAENFILALPAPQVLVVDEIGPLEVKQGRGWHAALDVLKKGQFQVGFVTYRRELAAWFEHEFPELIALEIIPGRTIRQADDLLHLLRKHLSTPSA